MNISIARQAGSEPIPCDELRSPHSVLGQRMHHLQVVNRYTTEWIFDSLGWWAGALSRTRSDIGRRASAECTEQTTIDHLGVLIGSRTARYSIICAPPPPGDRPNTCPCCWRAREEVAKELTTRCPNWNTAL